MYLKKNNIMVIIKVVMKLFKLFKDDLLNNQIVIYLFVAAEIAVFCFVVAMPS